MTIADRIRRSLASAGLTPSQAAELIGISRQAVEQWLEGKTAPRGENLRRLAAAVDADIVWLEHGELGARAADRRAEYRADADRELLLLWRRTPLAVRDALLVVLREIDGRARRRDRKA